MNIKNTLATVFALGAASFATTSIAAEATATASGTVIVPIAISAPVDLSFGRFAPGAGGTVTVSTSGARTASGAVLSAIGSTPTAARFDVTGDNDATYTITVAPLTALVHSVTPANTMALDLISNHTGANATTGDVGPTGTLDGTGAQSIFFGGTLTVAAAQAPGDYTGDIVVDVEYN